MSHSPLATISVPAHSNNYTVGRPEGRIEKITVHHMAGVLSAERCGQIFQNPNRHGSSHYGIGLNGEIAVYVEEENTAWTDSNWNSNIHSVTIENSNSSNGGNWPVSDATFDSLVKLCADIAKRNGIGKLVPGQTLTWHSMYASTSCPGDYLRGKMQELADKANAINYPTPEPTPTPTPTTKYKVGDVVNINGVYTSSDSTNKLAPAITRGTITKIIEGAKNPYLLDDGNIGWVNDGCIVGDAPTPKPSTGFKVGDKVTLTNYVDYSGTPLRKTRDFYYISELNGNRAVLRADNPTSGAVYAAVNTANLRLV